MAREIVERDRLGEPGPQILQRAPNGPRVLRVRGAEERERGNGFRERDLERQAIRTSAHRIVQAVERRGAFVAFFEMRDRDDLASVTHALDVYRGQPNDGEGDRPVVREIAMHVAGLFHQIEPDTLRQTFPRPHHSIRPRSMRPTA